jgi:Protein of unknown function (DUF2806)
MFARVLAGEIRRPSAFSIKTVKLLGELDARAATVFSKLCSLCVSLRFHENIVDARVVALGGNAGLNSLQAYGLSFDNLNVLQEHGLIIADYNSYMDYKMTVAANGAVGLPLTYQNKTWVLTASEKYSVEGGMIFHGVRLSRSGIELSRIVDLTLDATYDRSIREYLRSRFVELTPLEVNPAPTSG